MENQTVTLHYELKPAYYDRFRCLMGDCRLSCCKDGWKIAFDKKDYLKLRGLKCSPELKKEIEQGMRRIRKGPMAEEYYAEFDTDSGVCPMLTEEGLCELQLEQGGDVLPEVCKGFPRKRDYTPAGLERSLSPACEGMLELLWNLPEGVDFVLTDLPKPVSGKFDGALMPIFPDIRSLCIDFLQDRDLPLHQRVLLMGIALKDLADHPEEPEQWLKRAAALLADPERAALCAPLFREDDARLAMFLADNIWTLFRSSVKVDAAHHSPYLQAIKTLAVELGNPRAPVRLDLYRRCRDRFEERFGENQAFFENLLVSVFFQLCCPDPASPEILWKSYVSFCNLCSFYRFMAVLSCHDETVDPAAARTELFRYLVVASRSMIHNAMRSAKLRDEFFKNDSADLAHMAILLGG